MSILGTHQPYAGLELSGVLLSLQKLTIGLDIARYAAELQ